MTCSCGHDNPENHRFCGMCGAKLERNAEAPARSSYQLFDLRDPNDPARVIAPPSPREANTGRSSRDKVIPFDERRAQPEFRQSGPQSEPPAPAVPLANPTSEEMREVPELRQPDSPADAPIAEPSAAEVREYSFGGPSFLGLSGGDETESERLAYLTEEDERPRRTVRWGVLIAVVLMMVMATVFYNLYTNRSSWDSTIVKGPAAPAPPETAQASPPEPAQDTPDSSLPQGAATEQASGEASKADKASITDDVAAEKSKAATPEQTADQQAADKATSSAKEKATSSPEEDAETEAEPVAKKPKPSAARPEEPREENYAGAELYSRGDAYLRANNCAGVDLIRSAAEHGHPQARSRMGALYYTGKCVDQSYAQAYEWFTRAKASGLKSSSLDRMLARARANMETSAGTKVPERF